MIERLHGQPPRQIVLLPRGGDWYAGHFAAGGLTLAYDVIDLTRIEHDRLLAGPLAPLALLSNPGPTLLAEVVDQLESRPRREATAMLDLALLALGDDGRLTAILIDELRRRSMYSALRDNEYISS